MFKKLNNIDTAFRHVRAFCIIYTIALTLICAFITFSCFRQLEQHEQRLYILANGKAIEAFASGRKDNIAVEARDHIATFHRLFFSLDPDEKIINANIGKALYLADNSAEKVYDNLKEQGYYANVIAGNISQEISIDSIHFDISQYPYRFRCYAKEKLIRTTSIVTRNLLTEGYMRNTERSDNNPHGFLIERWSILENNDLSTQNRQYENN
ncbi:MAG: conjugative transposon protein TraK [Flavipsychrobacter sp.]